TSNISVLKSTPTIWRTQDGKRVWSFPKRNYAWISYQPARSSLIAGWNLRDDPRFTLFRLGRDGVPMDLREARARELAPEWLVRGEEQIAGWAELHRGKLIASMFSAISRPCFAYPDHAARRSLCDDEVNPMAIYELATKRIVPLANWDTGGLLDAKF